MKSRHAMPFGSEVLADGSVRFRLWAPAAQRVDLVLGEHRRTSRPMNRLSGGWFELATTAAGIGTRYSFRIDGALEVPDPASRSNPDDVEAPSAVVDPLSFAWNDEGWAGKPWSQAVCYEIHVGTFTPEGTFRALEGRLDYLAALGVNTLELMPVADFPGRRNWGYDGVLPFAPDSAYGPPEDLKHLIQSAHQKGLAVLLDVVYNHFGPKGNYLHHYAPAFFSTQHQTPWGAAINFDGKDARTVRDFFVHNALYWLEEYHFDGLRLDAVHALFDDARPDILEELAQAVRNHFGPRREIHLVLENDRNLARYLTPQARIAQYDAQWDDDIHHALHVLLTGETDGYYQDYAETPLAALGRCLTQGFAYQGEPSAFRNGEHRGESTAGLPLSAFVAFAQTHDQVGNRAFGERISMLAAPSRLRCALAVLLLAPLPVLLFMGEEFAAPSPFLYFCDYAGELGAAVTQGRRSEFSRFRQFADEKQRLDIPDPNSESTFVRSKLDWRCPHEGAHQEWLTWYRTLLHLRAQRLQPWLTTLQKGPAQFEPVGEHALRVTWGEPPGVELHLLANLGDQSVPDVVWPPGELIFPAALPGGHDLGPLPPWSVLWFLRPGGNE
ncbi:MAG: malto-oligosyltrehalose trehalohydrolase [Betaproteobacteria bacterium]|nr:malto-oligosyltrehalose trehalohydrolase [Betaproteobacteria bacterium]